MAEWNIWADYEAKPGALNGPCGQPPKQNVVPRIQTKEPENTDSPAAKQGKGLTLKCLFKKASEGGVSLSNIT